MSKRSILEPAAKAGETGGERGRTVFILVEVDGLTDELYPGSAERPAWADTVAARLLEVLDGDAVKGELAKLAKGYVVLGIRPSGVADDYGIRSFEGVRKNLEGLARRTLAAVGGRRATGTLLSPPDDENGRQLAAEMLLVNDRAAAVAFRDAVTRGEESLLGEEEGTPATPGGVVAAAVRHALGAAPAEYAKLRELLVEIGDAARQEIARALEPALNAEAAARPQATYDEKKELAKWINAELRRFGLALKAPKTGRPCSLVATTGPKAEVGRFVFDYVDDSGRRQHPMSSATLPRLELTLDDLTRTPYGQRSSRQR